MMSDFDERVIRALGTGAENAPDAHGLAAGARDRLRRRRQRYAVVGGAAAVVGIVVPAAVLAGSGDSSPGPDPDLAPADEFADVEVTCGGTATWPVSAMATGIPNDVDDAAVRDAFVQLRSEGGIDAPAAIQQGGADARYVVLAVTDDEITLGVGEWTADGAQGDAQVVTLEQTSDGLHASGWGDCHNLAVALPEGRSRVAVSAPKGGVDPSTTSLEMLVNEVECSSARDPRPYLGEPNVVETDDRVLVTIDSESVVGGADCQGNPPVPLTIELDEPIGERELLDAGTWPPTPIPVSELQTVGSDDGRVEIPSSWSRYTCDFDGYESNVFGPSEDDACGFRTYLGFYGSANFDAADLPGVVTRTEEDGEESWSGYVSAGEWVVDVGTPERELTRQILASARVDGQPRVFADRWRERSSDGLAYEAPEDGQVDVVVTDRPGGEPVVQSLPEQLDETHVQMYGDVGDERVTVTAPTQAVAELVLATVTPASSNDELRQLEVDGVEFAAPADWSAIDCPASAGQYFFGPGTTPCDAGEYATFYSRAVFDPVTGPGQVISGKENGETLWTGYVYAGDWAVYVRAQDRQLTEDILATVRQ